MNKIFFQFIVSLTLISSISLPVLAQLGNNCKRSDTNNDIRRPSNHGEIDDRTCRHKYSEGRLGSSRVKWGKYEISENSSTDKNNSVRMERKFAPRAKPANGAFQEFSGTFRINDVGSHPGTYFIQAKGKHVGHVDRDPAIALFQARKVRINGQIYFDIYREQITKRGGRFSNNGRRAVRLTRVKKDEPFRVTMKTGFIYKKGKISRHYVNVKIKNKWYYYNVPNPKIALETGIRYGAYVIRSGRAKIYVSNTSFKQVN